MKHLIGNPVTQTHVVYYCLLFVISISLFSCSTSRHTSIHTTNEAYMRLQLKKAHKDNTSLYKEAAAWLHVPYIEGGTSRKGTDCSFLVYSIYKTVYNITLERNSSAMMQKNCKQIKKDRLKEGDLVFFNTGNKSRNYINHVGIYLKNNKFLHASTSKGVMVSDLNEIYYQKTWVCGGRVK